MYLAHFNLHESPFSITPDPRFVYLTKRHREALAHLLYGLGEGGGFVQLTGEVGTGKTTICRTLLRQLPEHVDAALIFNPQLKVPELLEALCTELHIVPPGQGLSIKALVDLLYAYLLDANARGRRTVLILDEAQNLSSALLEEVRLLTNLETDDIKLLQVFLIGQPELRSKLASDGLRQLAQRITARYHLEPLNLEETGLYVRHRLAVAGCPRELFSSAALRAVHRLSGGIPRRINILCDRALLGAYATDSKRVSGAIVRRAHAEVNGEHGPGRARPLRYAALTVLAVGVLVLGALALTPHGPRAFDLAQRAAAALGVASDPSSVPVIAAIAPSSPDPMQGGGRAIAALQPPQVIEPESDELPDAQSTSIHERLKEVTEAADVATITPLVQSQDAPPPSSPEPSLEALIAAVGGDGWAEALAGLAQLWQAAPPPAGTVPCEWARTQGLECYAQAGSWSELRGLGLPAVLTLSGSGNDSARGLLLTLSADEATVLVAGREKRVTRAELEAAWNGEHFVLWRPPLASSKWIQFGQRGERVRWLRDTLASIEGIEPLPATSPAFDEPLLRKVQDFQRQNGLQDDGIVGPQTFIHLMRMASAEAMPSLSPAGNAGRMSAAARSVAMGSP